MSNNSPSLRSQIRPYFNKSRGNVVLRINLQNNIAEFQTDLKCSTSDFQNNRDLQIQIQDQINILSTCLAKSKNLESIRTEYYKVRGKEIQTSNMESQCFFQAIQEFINVYSGTLASNHLRNFQIMQRSLMAHVNRATLPPEFLTTKFLNNYTHSLVKSGLENSTIKGYLKRIKRTIRYSNEQLGTKIELSFELNEQLKEKSNFVVFLDKQEVEKFASVTTKTRGEQVVKDCFLFRCYTGIRFSEMPYIDINNYDGKVLSFYIPKSSKSHQIPLNRKALELLQKVKKFEPISQQKENIYIKRLAERGKIYQVVQRVKLSGSVSTVETHPKWKLCSSHTARRTWARIAYEAGIDILKISRYIGHSDIATTLNYIGHKDTDFDELKDLF